MSIDSHATIFVTTLYHSTIGLCTGFDGKVWSSIVSAGDPMQLEAVTKSKHAKQLGFSTSLMEQLFKCQLYKRNPLTNTYNPRFITQLLKNYRSHPDILKVPNELFYENRLKPQMTGTRKTVFYKH